MKTAAAYFTWTHPYGFRAGESGLIAGVVWLHTNGSTNGDPRACFVVAYQDGTIDYAPLSDAKHYAISDKLTVPA